MFENSIESSVHERVAPRVKRNQEKIDDFEIFLCVNIQFLSKYTKFVNSEYSLKYFQFNQSILSECH